MEEPQTPVGSNDELRVDLVSWIPLFSLGTFLVLYWLYYNCVGINSEINAVYEKLGSLGLHESEKGVIQLKNSNTLTPKDFVQDSMFRISWAISSLLLTCASIATVSIALSVMITSRRQNGCSLIRSGKSWLTLALLVGAWVWAYRAELSGYIGNLLYDVSNSHSIPNLDSRVIVDINMANVYMAILAITLACCAILRIGKRRDEVSQRLCFNLFRRSLFVAAMLLGSGVIHVFMLYKWQCSFLAADYGDTILSVMTFSVSVFYSIAFIVIFLPTYLISKERALSWARDQSKDAGPDAVSRSLEERGITYTSKNLAGVLSTLTSPIVIAVFSKFFEL